MRRLLAAAALTLITLTATAGTAAAAAGDAAPDVHPGNPICTLCMDF